MKPQAGFSLLELLMALAIVGIIMTIAIPSILSWLPNYQLNAVASDLLSNIQKAKIMAVKNRNYCAVRFDESGGTITGYTLFIDEDRNFEYNPDAALRPFESVVASVNMSDFKYVSITASTFDQEDDTGLYLFAFQPNGLPITDSGLASGSVTLTNTNGKTTSVVVNIAGNVRIQ